MSDLLDRLAARELGIESGLKPKVPALFESYARASFAVPAEAEPDLEMNSPAPAPLEHRHFDTAPTPMLLFPEPARERLTPFSAPTTMPPAAQAGLHPPRTEPRSEAVRVIETRLERERPAPSKRAVSPPPAPPRSPAFAPPRPHARNAPRIEPTAPRAPGTVRVAASPASVRTAPAAPAQSASPSPALQPSARDPVGRESRATRPHEERVVQVSIGRIELRAAAAAPAPRPRREAPRPTSIDDYLRRRGRGRGE